MIIVFLMVVVYYSVVFSICWLFGVVVGRYVVIEMLIIFVFMFVVCIMVCVIELRVFVLIFLLELGFVDDGLIGLKVCEDC